MLSEKPRGGLSETRKMTKSTMEKKRRARINSSLTELKAILSEMISNKGERFDKMEKADILEMTVKCVRQLQKQQSNSGDSSAVRSSSCKVDEDYRSGMHTCMSEVIKFISSSHFADADPEVKTKLLTHLANKLNSGTSQRTDMDRDAPYSYQKDSSPGKSVQISNFTSIDTDTLSISDLSNDSNNNFQTDSDKSPQFLSSVHQQKSKSPTPNIPSPSPVFTSYKPIQPVQEHIQQQGNVPTVPLTILVPANFCSTTLGTTCVIPVNLPTASPQQLCQGNVIQTVPQSPQTSFAITSNQGISLIQAPNLIQSAHPQTKAVELSNVSPQNKVYTFAPTVLSGYSPTKSRATSEGPQSTTAPFTMTLNSPDLQHGNFNKRKIDITTETTKESPIDFKAVKKSTEIVFNNQIFENPETVHQNTRGGNQNSPQNNISTFTFKNTSAFNDNHQDTRQVVYTDLYKRTDRTDQGAFSEINKLSVQHDNQSPVFNRNHGNFCDNAPDMWRPWNASI